MTPRENGRCEWVSYLRVSTAEQVERDLSIPAQRSAVAECARAHGAVIAREYVEEGHSGRDPHRPVFRRMIDDASARGSRVGTIVVHHTSRFTRDATEARIIKRRLRALGVRVVSTCQEIDDGPMGKLVEGIFECIDEYESEINGARTASALREAVRQGFFPGSIPPFGYATRHVEPRPGVLRRIMVHEPNEAEIVRAIFRLYVGTSGSKAVARELNRRGLRRRGVAWTKDLVLRVLEDEAVAGTFYWGRHATREERPRPRSEWLALAIEPIVDRQTFDLAARIRSNRESARAAHGASAPPHVLVGVVRCAKCGASMQLETSGKRVGGKTYAYSYYNCRSTLRAGRETCTGHRVRTAVLDRAVLERIADVVCTPERAAQLSARLGWSRSLDELVQSWRTLITCDVPLGRTYVRRLVDRIEVDENGAAIIPHAASAADAGIPNENAPL